MIGPLPYVGGKNRLARQIINLLPSHRTYVEAFSGGAQVFFHKEPSPVEVLNDLNSDVVNFLRVCQAHHEELIRHLHFMVPSRKWFDLLAATDAHTLTDVGRAARFYYLQKNAFGGRVVRQNFHYCVAGPSNFNPGRIPIILAQAHRRLQRVQLESLPYQRILNTFDRLETVFYLDPPYYGRQLYRFNFTKADFVDLEARLHRLKGKFILSLNNTPEIRKLFHNFKVREIQMAYSAQRQTGRRYGELLITNF